MSDIRRIVRQELPGARIHYALHYRYLLEEEGAMNIDTLNLLETKRHNGRISRGLCM